MKLFVLVPSAIAIAAVAGCTQDGLVDFDAAMALIEESNEAVLLEEKPEGKAEMSGYLGFGVLEESPRVAPLNGENGPLEPLEPLEPITTEVMFPEEFHLGRANVTADFDANTLAGTASDFKTFGVEIPDGCESPGCLVGTETGSLGGTLDIGGEIRDEKGLDFLWSANGNLIGQVSGVDDPFVNMKGRGEFYSVDGKLTAVGSAEGFIGEIEETGIEGILAVQE